MSVSIPLKYPLFSKDQTISDSIILFIACMSMSPARHQSESDLFDCPYKSFSEKAISFFDVQEYKKWEILSFD